MYGIKDGMRQGEKRTVEFCNKGGKWIAPKPLCGHSEKKRGRPPCCILQIEVPAGGDNVLRPDRIRAYAKGDYGTYLRRLPVQWEEKWAACFVSAGLQRATYIKENPCRERKWERKLRSLKKEKHAA